MVDEEREAVLLSGGRKELSLSRFGSCIGEPLYGRMGVVAVTVFAQWEFRILAG